MIESPILISGPGRSGTTFMQWFLSSHPRIQIFGHPYIPFAEWTKLIARFDSVNAKVASFNATHPIFSKYREPHHAGGVPGTFETELRDLMTAHYTGYGNRGKAQWGLKAIWACMNSVDLVAIKRLYPLARWIVCLRDPFKTIESIRSTFVSDYSLEKWFSVWPTAVEFAVATRSPIVKIDRVADATFGERKEVLDGVLQRLGVEPTEDTDHFIQEWPQVHRDVGSRKPWKLPEDEKVRQLEGNYRFVSAMKTVGYEA